MPDMNQKLDRFTAKILAEAADESKRALAEVKRRRELRFQEAEDAALKEAYEYIHGEVARIQSEAGRGVSRHMLENKRALYLRRTEMAQEVFALVRAKIAAFTRTPAYGQRLTALLAEALELVGMSGFARRSFSTLSGGEQQRVILARALAQQTPCLILDEPTNHLDIKYQLELMDIVKSLDRTVISAIHDLNIAAMYCDRLYAVKGGEIVGCGRPQEVLTEDFIRRVYEVEAKVFSDESGQLHILYHPAHRL